MTTMTWMKEKLLKCTVVEIRFFFVMTRKVTEYAKDILYAVRPIADLFEGVISLLTLSVSD